MNNRIGVSPLTGRIFRGRVNKAGLWFVGPKEDITSDVLKALIEKAEFHGGKFDVDGGGNKWLVNVTRQPATDAAMVASKSEQRADAATIAAERSSRGMFVALLENMRANGDHWLTVAAVLALLNDCDMLAAGGR